jgi:hypothetical protein
MVRPSSILAHDLLAHLQACAPAGVPFEDAVQICMRLYATFDGLPASLHGLTSREHLTDVFASLGASGWIRDPASNANVSSRTFWATVVSSVTTPTRWVFDLERAETVVAPFLGN